MGRIWDKVEHCLNTKIIFNFQNLISIDIWNRFVNKVNYHTNYVQNLHIQNATFFRFIVFKVIKYSKLLRLIK